MARLWRIAVGLAPALLGACEAPAGAAPWWRIERGGQVSYLLGTVHDGVEFSELPRELGDALASARLVITEADLRAVDEQGFRQAITLPPGESLRARLSAADWLLLVEAFAGLFPPAELERTQPWFLQGLLTSAWLPAEQPIDATLVRRAEQLGARLGFLETWQAQTGALNALGVEDGLVGLLPMVREPDAARLLIDRWLAAYRAGDLDRLTALSFAGADLAARPDYYAQIVFARTWRWVTLLEPDLEAGGAFVGVGFMHTLTDQGLACLLERRGFAVRAVGASPRRPCVSSAW